MSQARAEGGVIHCGLIVLDRHAMLSLSLALTENNQTFAECLSSLPFVLFRATMKLLLRMRRAMRFGGACLAQVLV